ncbi:MAG: PEP-CTERM/exosortase system-associated acyltransferase [Desulfuromonas sp.]|nr:PEP-CTERM/exosortase system-associated acyltransferase [Desulfuromonas sp.]
MLRNFRFCRAERDSLVMDEIYRLRYQIYCIERGFECATDYPQDMETDRYDKHSAHFYVIAAKSKIIIGTVRIILHSSLGLPVEHFFSLDKKLKYSGDPSKIGEISRLAVSRDLRRAEITRLLSTLPGMDMKSFKEVQELRREMEEYIVEGLYRCIYHQSLELGLTHWYAVMVESLCNLLRRWGLCWTQVGNEVDYHGLRTPYLAEIVEIEKSIISDNPQLLQRSFDLY